MHVCLLSQPLILRMIPLRSKLMIIMETVTQMTLQLQKKGISTLLDKTIYSQVAEGQQAQSDDYTADKAPFIAATITVVMIIYAYSYQMHQILNMYSIAIEIMRGIAGTIGIILTVPITSLIMSMLLIREKKAAPEKKQKCECK